MSYDPTVWKYGDKVTSFKLNKLENGLAGSYDEIARLDGDIDGLADDLDTEVAALRSQIGSPLVANTAEEMTNINKVYVYTGSETGYTAGHWYYFNGTAWADGGVYNSVAVQTDKTLTVPDMPADAKVTGDEIGALKEDLKRAIVDNETVIGNTNYAFSFGYQQNKVLSNSTGEIVDQTGYAVIDGYIPVNYGDQIRIYSTGFFRRCFYDGNKNFISAYADTLTGQWIFRIADPSVKFIRLCNTIAAIPSTSVYISNDKVTDNENSINLIMQNAGFPTLSVNDLEQGGFDANGLNDNTRTDCLRSIGYIEVTPNAKYKISMTITQANSPNISVSFYDVADGVTPRVGYTNYSANELEFTVPQSARYIRVLSRMQGADYFIGYVTGITFALAEPLMETVFNGIKKVTSDGMVLAYPNLYKLPLNLLRNRVTNQDIAVYNGHIIEADVGFIKINGGSQIAITNGHGNNCNFGVTLHGTYPYLYCPAWNENEPYIYVNEITDSTATLKKTITYTGLTGYLNAVVDEANDRAYIFLADDPYTGNITFVIGDLDGNIISQKALAEKMPIIQGMDFKNDSIYVLSGSPNTNDKMYLWTFDTAGNITAKTAMITPSNVEIEGISFDTDGTLYVANIQKIYIFTE